MNKLHLTSLKLAAFAVAGLLLGSSATRAQTPPSPVGDWDLVYSGSQKGLALLTFNSDNTLTGYEIVRPTPRKGSTSTDVDPRHPGGELGRTVVTTTPGSGSTAPKVITNFLGSAQNGGIWYHDSAGKIIGLLSQVSATTVKPVETYMTNIVDGQIIVTTNTTLEAITVTNAVSFRGIVAPGSRITINTYGPNGNNTLRGTPATINTNLLSGDFYAVGKRAELNFIEFLNLQQDSLLPSLYNLAGNGAGYSFFGEALVSNRKQIAVVTLSLDGSAVLSVYTGSFNLVSHKGKLSGVDSSSRKLTYNLSPLP